MRGLPPVQQLFETTRAYPGHVEHVVRYLLEGGKAEDTSVSLPDLVAARLSMLTQSTRDVLQAAAVLGIEPQLDLLRSMLPSDRRSRPRWPTPRRSGLLGHDPSGELTFTSRLVRDIVYDATPADVRRSLHAQAAAAVEAMSPDIALLGHHHDLAGHAKEAIDAARAAPAITPPSSSTTSAPASSSTARSSRSARPCRSATTTAPPSRSS